MQERALAFMPARYNMSAMVYAWLIIVFGGVAALLSLRAFLGYREVARDAEDDYRFKTDQNMIDKGLTQEVYTRAYRRFYAPRSKAYMAGGLMALIVSTPIAFGLINFLLTQLWIATGKSKIYEPGFFVWQFMIFFAILATWALIIYLVARRFYAKAPISFKDELKKETGG